MHRRPPRLARSYDTFMTDLAQLAHAFSERLGALECRVADERGPGGEAILDFDLRGEWRDSVDPNAFSSDTSWGKTEPALPDASFEKATDDAIRWEMSLTRHLPTWVYTRRLVDPARVDVVLAELERRTSLG